MFSDVLTYKARADAMRNALTILQRYRFLFSLPRTIEVNIKKVCAEGGWCEGGREVEVREDGVRESGWLDCMVVWCCALSVVCVCVCVCVCV